MSAIAAVPRAPSKQVMYLCIYLCMHALCMHVCMYECMYVCVHVQMCVCVCVCVCMNLLCINVCMYMHAPISHVCMYVVYIPHLCKYMRVGSPFSCVSWRRASCVVRRASTYMRPPVPRAFFRAGAGGRPSRCVAPLRAAFPPPECMRIYMCIHIQSPNPKRSTLRPQP